MNLRLRRAIEQLGLHRQNHLDAYGLMLGPVAGPPIDLRREALRGRLFKLCDEIVAARIPVVQRELKDVRRAAREEHAELIEGLVVPVTRKKVNADGSEFQSPAE